MLWRSSGHSGGGIEGESSSHQPESAYESRLALEWFDYYLRGIGDPAGARLLVPARLGRATRATPRRPSASRRSYPAGPDADTLYLSGTNPLGRPGRASRPAARASRPSRARPARAAAFVESPVPDVPGTSASTTPRRSPRPPTSWASRLRSTSTRPTFAQPRPRPGHQARAVRQAARRRRRGGATLPRNLLSAVRVARRQQAGGDRAAGHRPPVRQGPPDAAGGGHRQRDEPGNTVAGPVSIATDPPAPGTLTLPRVGAARLHAARPLPCAPLADRPAQHRPHPAGYTRSRLLRRVRVQPERRTARTYRYCVTGRAGVVSAVFSSRSRRAQVRLVTTTARGHGNRRVRVRSKAARFRRAYPHRAPRSPAGFTGPARAARACSASAAAG